jgi:hypothetical protein
MVHEFGTFRLIRCLGYVAKTGSVRTENTEKLTGRMECSPLTQRAMRQLVSLSAELQDAGEKPVEDSEG